MHDVTVNVGESVIEAAVVISQSLMIETEQAAGLDPINAGKEKGLGSRLT